MSNDTSRILSAMVGLDQLAMTQHVPAPDRSGSQHDNHSQYRTQDFYRVIAAHKQRRHPQQRERCIELQANRSIPKTLQLRMNRRISRDDAPGDPSQQRRAGLYQNRPPIESCVARRLSLYWSP